MVCLVSPSCSMTQFQSQFKLQNRWLHIFLRIFWYKVEFTVVSVLFESAAWNMNIQRTYKDHMGPVGHVMKSLGYLKICER